MYSCRKASLSSSAAQWNLDALVATPENDLLPCFFSVLPTGCAFQTVSSEAGEALCREAARALGPPATPPQVVKGGSCGGEEEESEFAFVGAMLSVTWEFPRDSRDDFIKKIKLFLGECEGLTA